MRFHYGAPPEAAEFHPEEGGWQSIREPGPMAIQLLAVPVALGVVALVLALADRLVPHPDYPAPIIGLAPILYQPMRQWPLLLLLLIPIHELIHAIGFPESLRSRNTVVGAWLQRGLFYAHYDGPITRERFLLVLALPFLALTGAPLAALAFVGGDAVPGYLASAALINGAACAGDLLGIVLIARQIPRRAMLRNSGWCTYWRHREPRPAGILGTAEPAG